MVDLVSTGYPAGEPFKIKNEVLWTDAWAEFIELRVQTRADFVKTCAELMAAGPRLEVVAYDNDVPVGGVCLHYARDAHVGYHLALSFQYIRPAWRSTGLYNRLLKAVGTVCRAEGVKVIAYTHRVRDWTYLTKYRVL